ncbi:D-amino-acid oxidase [Streptacidiphilus sp. BW17]|uniref:FAD-dependent oxidoreductase n=1 Tax=Streptacidiphilus sp. BW17 TaxID=3156274 RepID=UPI003515F660
MSRAEQVTVVGAGVIGLTTAVVLAESGLATTVVAAEIPGRTSLAAGAMWGPYLVEPKDKVERWSQRSLETFTELAKDPGTGVRITSGIEASRHEDEAPDWARTLPGFRACKTDELPSGFISGFSYAVPLIDMPVYLDYLLGRAAGAGVTIETRHLTTLAALELGPLVVNCTGLGAARLANDAELKPIRGQHVVVSNPGITEFFSEDTGPSEDLLCIYPHGETVVLGGTAITDRGDVTPDEDAAAAILRRCQAIDSRLGDAQVLEHRIGTRPTRPSVRVEREQQGNRVILHNYGHGGAGVTLSWGCADEIAALAAQTGT